MKDLLNGSSTQDVAEALHYERWWSFANHSGMSSKGSLDIRIGAKEFRAVKDGKTLYRGRSALKAVEAYKTGTKIR